MYLHCIYAWNPWLSTAILRKKVYLTPDTLGSRKKPWSRAFQKQLEDVAFLSHKCGMTDIFRVRIERDLVKEATKVAEEMGTTPGEIVRMLFAQIVKRRALPFEVRADSGEDALIDVSRRNRVLRELDDSEGW